MSIDPHHPRRLRRMLSGLALAAMAAALATAVAAQPSELRRKGSARPAAAARTMDDAVMRPAPRRRPPPSVTGTRPPATAPAAGLSRGPAGQADRSLRPPVARPLGAAAPARVPAPRRAAVAAPGAYRGLRSLARPAFARPAWARPGAGDPGLRQGMTRGGLGTGVRGRPNWMRPGFGRPAFAAMPRPTGRFGASPAWAAMRQRFFVPPPVSLGPPPGRGIGRSRHEMEVSGVPPAGERRFIADEVVIQVDRRVARAEIDRLTRRLGASVVASHSFDAAGRTLYHIRAAAGRDVAAVVRELEQDNVVAAAQPNYVYRLDQAVSAPAVTSPRVPRASLPAPSSTPKTPPLAGLPPRPLPAGDPTQYAVAKLRLSEVHRQARGRDVRIAVIDSAVDARHPDLAGGIAESVDPSGRPGRPHPHGTGMAGAIVARAQLLGVAPDASVVAIKVFDERDSSPEATSFQILKGLDLAMRRGVRIINMSFAGPYDVMLERKLREAYDKGIVLVAAAGNAGPDSPPLYPAADPSVIAVTATDAGDKPFAMAVRGAHVALAAPGVDILVPSPGGAYQLTTGTSVAAAHVSGAVALMLEKRPDLTPEDVRAVLVGSATPTTGTRPGETVALVNPLAALSYEPPETDTPATAIAGETVPRPVPAATQSGASAAPAARSTIEQRWPKP